MFSQHTIIMGIFWKSWLNLVWTVVKFINFEKATQFEEIPTHRFDIYVAGNVNSKVKSGRFFSNFVAFLENLALIFISEFYYKFKSSSVTKI